MEEILDNKHIPARPIVDFKPKLLLYWIPVFFIGWIFYLLRWPGSSILILLSTAGIGAYTLSGFIRLKGKDAVNTIAVITTVLWITVLLIGAAFFEGHPFNYYGVIVYFISFAVCFGIQEIIRSVRKAKLKKR